MCKIIDELLEDRARRNAGEIAMNLLSLGTLSQVTSTLRKETS